MVVRVIRHPRPTGAPSALRTVLVAFLTALVLLAPGAGVASADTFDDIYSDFRKQQKITACKYTPSELQDAKDKLGSDSEQYLPGFPDALDEAIAASGTCKEKSTGGGSSSGGGGGSGSGTTTSGTPSAAPSTTTSTTQTAPSTTSATPPATTPAPAPTAQPAPAAQTGVIAARAEAPADEGPEAWTWALLAAAIVGAAGLGWAFVNATGRIEALTPLGHSMGEAGWRISLRWAEFRDWMRFGSGR